MAAKTNKSWKKKTGEELDQFLQFRKRGSQVAAKKGKGSFKRAKKHRGNDEIYA